MIGWAVEALADHWDGYFFTFLGPNNYYVYHHPGTNRFVFLVAGMDSMFVNIKNPLDTGRRLLRKLLQFPETRAQLRDTLSAIVRDFDVAAMHARIDQVARTIHTHTPTDSATMKDFASFDSRVKQRKQYMSAIKLWVPPTF
jgi:hypothetical protein